MIEPDRVTMVFRNRYSNQERVAYARYSFGMRWSSPETSCMARNRLEGGTRLSTRGGVESRRRLGREDGNIPTVRSDRGNKKGSCGVMICTAIDSVRSWAVKCGWVGLAGRFRMVVVLFLSTGLGFTRASALHVAKPAGTTLLVADSQARSFHGSFVLPPVPAQGAPPLQAGLAHRAVALAQWERQPRPVLKVVAGSLPMSIPTLPSRCIILKSWAPDAIPDIISVQHINTATRAWSLTGQEDHEHWQDLRRHSSRNRHALLLLWSAAII